MQTERYQDYVIKDGRLVGKFEEMYQKFDDPWEQTTRESFASEKAVAINQLASLNLGRIIELGCGFGHFSDRIRLGTGAEVIGIDVSETAITKAKSRFPNTTFKSAAFSDFQLLESMKPDAIVMAEITWYVLEELPAFLEFMKRKLPDVYLLHLLNVYPPGEQKYGKEFFFDLNSILNYFGMNYVEFGEVVKPFHGNCRRTFFLGRYSALDQEYRI